MAKAFAQEACAWVPGACGLLIIQVLSNVHLYMSSNGAGSPRRPGDPEILGYKVLDDRGGSGHFQLRVEGLTKAQLQRIVGRAIDVTMEHV